MKNFNVADLWSRDKRSLIILFYIPALSMVYHISAISFKVYTFFFIMGMLCLTVLNLSKNTTFKRLAFSFIGGLFLFLLGFLLYSM
ncbi:hypothetical protein DRF59_11270 [Chryseobacterium flavum]|uniref:Uncharacterized protein n=1 Tax=Chryseobacterium flavum TaxID=415851 RepID=A0A3D9CME4_9FLAO|nr:hypothetical protein DRF59_11270 [Chryseobacterium flavum]